MIHIYVTDITNGSLAFYDETANDNANHSNETFLAKYADEEYMTLEQPIRFIDGSLTFGYTEAEKARQAKEKEIEELKSYLTSTDYIHNVIAEGDATENQYKETLQKRHEVRLRIRELENNV